MIGKRGYSKSMQLKDQGLNKKDRVKKIKHESELREKEEPIQFSSDETGLWVVNKNKELSKELEVVDTPKKDTFDKESFLSEIREAIRLRNLNLST